ncbi:MAG: hypothetical protein RRY23_00170 [Alistipes sp.]
MLAIRNRTTGNNLNIIPGQEITFTLDNPLFSDDRLPITVSTGIELALTSNNKMECGFVEAMMLPPTIQTIPVSIILSGIEIFIGELQFDEYTDRTLQYSFTGRSMESLEGKIHEIKCEDYKGVDLTTLTVARNEAYPDFGLPMIIRKENSAKFEYWSGQDAPECSVIDKYANWLCSLKPYIIPAVKVAYILNKILPNILFSEELTTNIKHLAILGMYKPEAWRNAYYGIPVTPVTPVTQGEYVSDYVGEFNVADSLPDMAKTDFVSNVLKMFCATMFADGENYCVRLNKDDIVDQEFVDWTNNVGEIYSIISGEAEQYSLSYANRETQTFNPQKEDKTEDGPTPADSIQICTTYEAMLTKFKAAKNYINIKIKHTGDIYSGKGITANLDPDIDIPMMDMVYQAGLDEEHAGSASDKIKKHDVTIDFLCPKTIPANVTYTKPFLGNNQVLLQGVSPIIDIPAMDNARSSDVYIGLLFNHNFLIQGNYYTHTILFDTPNSEVINDTSSIALGGENGLYNRFHKTFAEWSAKKKDSIKADVFLSPTDVATLRLWRKIMIYNRLFIIKTMELTISDKTDLIFANAEFVEA